jgi:hypothetical protein
MVTLPLMLSPSKPLPVDERTLIEAWHSPDSTATIAVELGIKGSELDIAFRALKREGKLPQQSRQQAHQRAETVDSSTRPAADEDGCNELLDLLIQHHGNDDPSGERADLYPGCRRR